MTGMLSDGFVAAVLAGCVFRRSRSRFRDDADQRSAVMAITVAAKRRWVCFIPRPTVSLDTDLR